MSLWMTFTLPPLALMLLAPIAPPSPLPSQACDLPRRAAVRWMVPSRAQFLEWASRIPRPGGRRAKTLCLPSFRANSFNRVGNQ